MGAISLPLRVLCSTLLGVAILAFLPISQAKGADCNMASFTSNIAGRITAVTQEAPAFQEGTQTPAFCRVQGIAENNVGFEVWLPESWNGRLVSVGNGGLGGSLQTLQMRPYLAQGYAVTANDTGHTDKTMAWLHDPAAVYTWGHTATHNALPPSKNIVRLYYGKPAAYSYFFGCSTGGAQAMEEAEFYPEDFDGIVASCPGMYYSHLLISFLWGLKVTTDHALLSPEKLALLNASVLQQCDGLDGVKDGLIENPLACHFDPSTLKCATTVSSNCLTEEEIKTVILLYQGPKNPRTGEAIYPGFVPGSEYADADSGMPLGYGWAMIQKPLGAEFAIPVLQHLVFGPDWDWKTFDFDKDVARVDAALHDKIDSMNPDLRAFLARGGKLIMLQGWGDLFNGQTLPIEYRKAVIADMAKTMPKKKAEAVVDSFFRLFMAPGMSHCIGGPGPSVLDPIEALRDWVEHGKAPEKIIAKRFTGAAGNVPMSRPLCPYPKMARWDGKNPTNDAASFSCAVPAP